MKTTETLNASIGRILDENLQLDMPRPFNYFTIKTKKKVIREIIELIESHDAELTNIPTKDKPIEKLKDKKDELIDWLETECQSPETADLSHSFAENLMIRLVEIRYIESEVDALEKELLENKCHKLYNLIKEANTPDIRSFEEAEKELAAQKEEILGDRYFKRVQEPNHKELCEEKNRYETCINPHEILYRGCTNKCKYFNLPTRIEQKESVSNLVDITDNGNDLTQPDKDKQPFIMKEETDLSAEETIKEILKKRIKQLIVDDIISPFYWDDFTKELLSSMEEYRQAGIREELINYDKYCGSHNIGPNLLSPESNVDEYLKSQKA